MKKYDVIQLGERASIKRLIEAALVEDYARLSGDNNPVHLDEAAAAKTIFRKRIAHGLLVGALVSAVLGTALPGPGAIYLSQEFEFKAAVYLGDEIEATVEVLEKEDRHKKIKLRTYATNQKGQLVLDGFAWVLHRV